MTTQNNDPIPPPAPSQWPKFAAVAAVAVAALVLIGYLFTGDAIRGVVSRGLGLGERIVNAGPDIAERFRTGRITLTFRESLPRLRGSRGDTLEVAVFESDEIFQITDERRVAWDLIDLGTSVAEIRAPVTFRYHILLSDDWSLETRGQVCLVSAPRLRASLPPAIHTDRMEKHAESGWARFDRLELLEKLEKDLTPMLERRALQPEHLDLARETARRSVADFVKNWLLREDHWRSDRFSAIVVSFPDDPLPPAQRPATVVLKDAPR